MAQTDWKVTHYDHAGNALGESFPNDLHFDLYLDKVGDIQYSLDASLTLAQGPNCRAYYTDYILQRGTRNIQAGMHTGISLGEPESNAIEVSGLDWLHYFEKCFWPFDPTNPTGGLYLQAGRDVALVVKDLLDTILAQTNRLTFAYVLAAVGQLTDYRIDVADSTDLLQRILTLAQTKPGFDFDVSPDLTRTFRIYAPKKGTTRDYVFSDDNSIITAYTNVGPKATHTLNLATSSSGGQLGVNLDSANQAATRRLDGEEQFDNVLNVAQLTTYANGQLDRDSTDQITFTVKHVPLPDEDFWSQVDIGDTCQCYFRLINSDIINDFYRVVGISCDPDEEGGEEISVTFDYGSLSL